MDSPRKFDDQGLDVSPPRLASLGMTQLQFHRSTEDIVLHTKIQLFDNSKYDGKLGLDGKWLKALNRTTKVSASSNEVELEQSESVEENDTDNDDDDDVDDDDDDEGGGLWELTKIYTVSELKKVKPIMCMTKKCNLVACSRWEPIEGGTPWDTCLDCQAV